MNLWGYFPVVVDDRVPTGILALISTAALREIPGPLTEDAVFKAMVKLWNLGWR